MAIEFERQGRTRDVLRGIPAWAVVLASLLFLGMQVLWHVVLAGGHDAPPFWFRFYMGIVSGIILGFWGLLIGYVNRDSGRRGMSRMVWTLVVILVPYGIGALIYFVLRQPLAVVCPHCGAQAQRDFNYCSRCAFQLAPSCPHCQRPVRSGDPYCPYCGRSVEADAQPSHSPATR